MDRPSRQRVVRHAALLAMARAAFGAPAVAAPDHAARMLRHSRGRRRSAQRMFAGFFGVREVLLGAFMLAARGDLQRLRATAAFGALADSATPRSSSVSWRWRTRSSRGSRSCSSPV